MVYLILCFDENQYIELDVINFTSYLNLT